MFLKIKPLLSIAKWSLRRAHAAGGGRVRGVAERRATGRVAAVAPRRGGAASSADSAGETVCRAA